MKSIFIALLTLGFLAPASAAKAEEPKEFKPADYTVYIDKQTGFAFVRTPSGWKFVRKIESPVLVEQAVQLQLALNEKR